MLSSINARSVQIVNYSFAPASFEARAGDTIFFQNFDETPHQIMSQSAENLFDATGVFASDFIDLDEIGYVVVPDSALAGDLFFFYCEILKGAMATPNGVIAIID